MKKSYFLWSLLGLLTLQLGWAQQKTITGTVNDETGLPLPGATVVIDGTTRGFFFSKSMRKKKASFREASWFTLSIKDNKDIFFTSMI